MTELTADGQAPVEPDAIYLGAELVLTRPDVDWTRHKGDGRPKILPPPGVVWRNPGTNRKVGHRYYTRVTTFADAITESYNLTAWKLRRALYGAAQRRDYLLRLASLTLEDRDRDELDAVVQLCLEAAGPNAAEMGTALHSLTERIDRGEDLGNPPEEVLPDLAAYVAVTEGLITYRHREARVVCDELECAGTPDGHAVVHEAPPTDRGVVCDCPPDVLRIIDTKTGSIRYPGKMSTQLAIYSRSDLYNPETGERIPITVCPHWGVIVHLPVETGEAALFWLDLAHGWAGAELCGPVRTWHKAKADDILVPFTTAKPVKVVEGEITRIDPRPASWNPKAPTERAPDPGDITEALKVSAERVVEERVAIMAGHDEARAVAEVVVHDSGHVEVVGEPELDGALRNELESEDAADLDGTDPVRERFAAHADGQPEPPTRCRTWAGSDPGAAQCELGDGHAGGHEYRTEPTPAEVRLDPLPLAAMTAAVNATPEEQQALAELAEELGEGAPEQDGTYPEPDDDEPADGSPPYEDAGIVTDPHVTPGPVDPWPGVDEVDPIAEAIKACVHVRELEHLGAREWRTWTPEHKALASQRHDELAAVEAARKPVAAYEAAITAATSRADLIAAVGACQGEPWFTPQLEGLASARWGELR